MFCLITCSQSSKKQYSFYAQALSLCAWLWRSYKALMFVPWYRWRAKTRLQPSSGRPWSNTTWSGRRPRNMSWCRKSLKTKVKTKNIVTDCHFSMWDEIWSGWITSAIIYILIFFIVVRILLSKTLQWHKLSSGFLGFCLFLLCCGSQGGIPVWPSISNKFIDQLDTSAYLTQNLFCYHHQ